VADKKPAVRRTPPVPRTGDAKWIELFNRYAPETPAPRKGDVEGPTMGLLMRMEKRTPRELRRDAHGSIDSDIPLSDFGGKKKKK
jgi:hypothetical protein